jgi:putative redox protein
MKHFLDLAWKEAMAFEADVDGHQIVLDAAKESGGADSGFRPKKLMMVALAGCTGMDVISILRKMKVEPESFHVLIDADVADDHPMKYTAMKIIFQLKGRICPWTSSKKQLNYPKKSIAG